jgi:hypothetical protein
MTATREDLTGLQTQLEALAADDPRRVMVEAQVCDLLREHGAGWAGPRAKAGWARVTSETDEPEYVEQFGPVFGEADRWQFRGGRLAVCSTTMSEFIRHGEAMRRQTNLQELSLSGIGGERTVRQQEKRLAKLRSWKAPRVILDNEVEKLKRLRTYCPVETVIGCELLRGVGKLDFNLSGLFEDDVETFAAAKVLEDMESLSWYQDDTDATRATYRSVARLSRLKTLTIEFNSGSGGDVTVDPGNEGMPGRSRRRLIWESCERSACGITRPATRGCWRWSARPHFVGFSRWTCAVT